MEKQGTSNANRLVYRKLEGKKIQIFFLKINPKLGLKGKKVSSLVFFDKEQCLYGILDGKLLYLDGSMNPKVIAKIQISQEISSNPNILRKDRAEKYLFVQTSKTTIQILSNVEGGRLIMYSMVELRKGTGIIDFVPFGDKKLVVITEDGFVCPYTFNENYSKRLKSPKLVLKSNELLSKCKISRDDKTLIMTSRSTNNLLFQVYSFDVEPEEATFTFSCFYGNDILQKQV